MDPRSRINVSGLLKNLLNLGFSLENAMSELIDDAYDADANEIRIIIKGGFINFADDGCGMKKSGFPKYHLFDEKEKSQKNGFAGIGGPVAEAVLSNEEGISMTLTKAEGNGPIQAVVDFPTSIRDGEWFPSPNDISHINYPLWEGLAINPQHGTVVRVQMAPSVSAKFENPEFRTNIISEIGRTYAQYIEGGRKISWQHEDDTPIEIEANPCLPDVDPSAWKCIPIEVWTKDATVKTYFPDPKQPNNGKMMTCSQTQYKLINAPEYAGLISNGYIKHAEFPMTFAYEEDARDGGKIFFQREEKIIASFENDKPKGGDHAEQNVLRGANHKVEFRHNMDQFIRPEINKSRLTEANINPVIMRTIRVMAKALGKLYYKEKNPTVGNPTPQGSVSTDTLPDQVVPDAVDSHEKSMKDLIKLVKNFNERVNSKLDMNEDNYTDDKSDYIGILCNEIEYSMKLLGI